MLWCIFFLVDVCSGAVTIEVNQTVVQHRTWVRVTWGGVPAEERAGCWIGLIAPADGDVSRIYPPAYPYPDYPSMYSDGGDHEVPWIATSPVKFITCVDADRSFASSGAGQHDFYLLNIRQDAVFRLFYNYTTYPVAIAKTSSLTFSDANVPVAGHLARTTKLDEMLVQWTGPRTSEATVMWGTTSGQLVHNVSATWTTYAPSDLCGQPAVKDGFFDPGHLNRAVIQGLRGERVFYKYGSPLGWSAEHSFLPPPVVAASSPARLLLVADSGATEPDDCHTHWSDPTNHDRQPGQERQANITLLRLAQAPQADVVLHIGDLSYATGYLAKWELFMNSIEAVATRTPYMVQSGNHERDWPKTNSTGGVDSGGECGVPTHTRFLMPTPSQGATWYSFDVGSIHVVMMDTEVACGRTSAQYAFLEGDLAGVNRTRTPWVVFAGHRPMYYVDENGGHGPEITSSFCIGGEAIEPLLLKHKVDVALWGHVHNIVRTCPLYDARCRPEGQDGAYTAPRHVVIGHGGQNQTPIPTKDKSPKWSMYSGNPFGYADITASNATHLSMSIWENLPLDGALGATVVDSFTIVRPWPRAY